MAAGDASGGGKECPYALELNPLQNGPVVGPATYVTLTPASYKVTVYVARTHREIGSTQIVGDDRHRYRQLHAPVIDREGGPASTPNDRPSPRRLASGCLKATHEEE